MECRKLTYQNYNFLEVVHSEKRVPEIKKCINYYPFGLKHSGYNNTITGRKHKYGIGGKEFQDELGLNWYDVSARNYDPALGRWMNLDPLAEEMRRHSPYNFGFDNPVYWTDPDGMSPIPFLTEESVNAISEAASFIGDYDSSEKLATVTVTASAGKAKNNVARRKSAERARNVEIVSERLTQEDRKWQAELGNDLPVEYHNDPWRFISEDLSMLNPVSKGIGTAAANIPTSVITTNAIKVVKPTISQIKTALKKVYKELDIDGSLPKMEKGSGPQSTPRAGDKKKGYRLDPPHDKHKNYWHLDWWKGKRKAGKTGTIKIE